MKRAQPSKKVRILLATGCLFTSLAAFIHIELPKTPDVAIGLMDGLGIGILIGGLIKNRKEKAACASLRE